MSAHALPLEIDKAYRTGFFKVRDPGASGTISWSSKGWAFCEVVTAAAESRALPAASSFGIGTKLTVAFKTDGGDLTITGASAGSVVLDTVGDRAEFVVSLSGTTKIWKHLARALGERQRLTTSATSGTVEGLYTRLAFTADGTASGEALRAFTNVNANIGTAHGGHISLSYSAVAGASETSGLGTAIRGTTHIPDIAAWAPTGTVYAGMLELYSDGTASDPAGLTELAVLCLSNSGDATGKADVDTDAAIISIQGFTAAAGVTNAVTSTPLAELAAVNAVGFRVKVGSTLYYIPIVPAADWN